jgi:hypothetical protein
LLSALAAFAVPAAFGVAHPLPTVPADATQPGLGHRGLLVGEPFRLGQGHPEGPDAESIPLLLLASRDPRLLPSHQSRSRPRSFAGLDLGSGDDDQVDAHPGPVACSTIDAMGGTRVACSRSVPSSKATIVSVRSFSTNSRPALRAAAVGGRPRAGNDTTLTGRAASPLPPSCSKATRAWHVTLTGGCSGP